MTLCETVKKQRNKRKRFRNVNAGVSKPISKGQKVIPSLKDVKFPVSLIRKAEGETKKSKVLERIHSVVKSLCQPNTFTSSSNFSNLLTSGSEPQAKKFSQANYDIPEVIRNHPRFSLSLKASTSIKLENKGLLSNSQNALKNSLIHPYPKAVPERDKDVYLRLFEDIKMRLTFYVNEKHISKDEANNFVSILPKRMYCNLPRSTCGKAIYDDSSFERIHLLLNAEVQNKFSKQRRNHGV